MLFEWWTTIVPIYTTQINASMRNHWPYICCQCIKGDDFKAFWNRLIRKWFIPRLPYITHRTYHAVHWYWRSELSRIFRLLAIIRLKKVHLYFRLSYLPIPAPKIAIGWIDYSIPLTVLTHDGFFHWIKSSCGCNPGTIEWEGSASINRADKQAEKWCNRDGLHRR